MNIPNLTRLRDFLLELPESQFDMGSDGHWSDADRGDCKSAACIGGWTRALFRVDRRFLNEVGHEALGLTCGQAESLFFPDLDHGSLSPYDATPTQAAAVLTHLINTGEVDWTKMGVQATDEQSGLTS